MRNQISKHIKNLSPYVPGENPNSSKKLIKLNTNEHPYGPPKSVLREVKKCINDKLRLYPDSSSKSLIKALSEFHQLNESKFFVGNGSDEVLAHAFNAFFKRKNIILFPDITYSFYPSFCKLYEINYQMVPLNSDFQIVIEDYFIKSDGIIFPNPNAPTGIYLSQNKIKILLEKCKDKIVVIDEAYADFSKESCIKMVEKYSNLLVTRSFSKSHGLAGLRIGYAIGNEFLIESLNRVKNSFNSYPLDTLAQAAATKSLLEKKYFTEKIEKISQTREETKKELKKIDFVVLDSSANFLFISHKKLSGLSLYKKLFKAGFLVRHFKSPQRIKAYIRVTIGKKSEMTAFINFLKNKL